MGLARRNPVITANLSKVHCDVKANDVATASISTPTLSCLIHSFQEHNVRFALYLLIKLPTSNMSIVVPDRVDPGIDVRNGL